MNNPHLVLGVLEGDDIGHEIVPAAVEVASAAAAQPRLAIDWRPMPIGRRALDTHGSTFPRERSKRSQRWTASSSGPIGHRDYPKVAGAINPHPIMRKHFNLFANVRPTRSYPDIGACTTTSTWSSCARTTKASSRTATSLPAPANSGRPKR